MDGTSGSDLADNQPRTVSPVEPDDGKELSGIEVKVIPDQTKGVLNKSEKQNAAAAVDDHNTAENKDESGDKDEKEAKKKEEEKPPAVPLLKLFRFRDKLDVLLMVLATLSSICHGAAFPLQFIIFGELMNSFISYAKFQTANVTQPFDLEGDMTKFALYYVYMACGTLIVSYGQMGLWSVTATRQVRQMRLAFFRSVLKQDIGWFDTTDPGELNNRLSEDLNKVEEGIGHKIGMLLQAIATSLVGFIMGFVYGWKLTLVMIAASPLVVIAGGIIGKLMATMTTRGLNAYAKAGSIAEEVFSSIRTVAAFGGEKKEIARYSSHLGEARDYGIKKGYMSGLGFGFFQIITFASYSLAFWYGSKLIIGEEMTAGQLLIVFFAILIGAMQLGQAGHNMESIATAKGAAYQVFLIIDRVKKNVIVICTSY